MHKKLTVLFNVKTYKTKALEDSMKTGKFDKLIANLSLIFKVWKQKQCVLFFLLYLQEHVSKMLYL